MENRKPILAIMLSFFCTGLGQLYNGQWKKAILLMILLYPILVMVGMTGMLSSFTGMLICLSVIFSYILFVCYDAYIWAKKLTPYQIKPANTWPFYIVFIVFWYALVSIGPSVVKKIIGYQAFGIPTSSMEPTLQVGDKIIATKIKPEEIQIGDIITFTLDDGLGYLSRVVGLPDQNIEIIGDQVTYTDGSEQWTETKKSISEGLEYQEYKSKLPNGKEFETKRILKYEGRAYPTQEISNISRQKIPKGKVFVMGDSRNNSMDSRVYGLIDFEKIDKKVNYIWSSQSMKRIGTKLD